MRQKFTVLVIDDQPDARNMLRITLSGEGFKVLLAEDAVTGLRMAYENHPDAVLLDIMMPDVDGYEACRRIREMTNIPVIFVTAKDSVDDKVRGFSLGADDYIVKPFNISELKYRLMGCLRRSEATKEKKAEVLFPADSVMLDCGRHELVVNDRTIYLTPKEFEVLRFLVRHAGKVLTTDAILLNVWGSDRIGEPDLVKQYIYRLRRKIGKDDDSPSYIHTIWGSGYYFHAETAQSFSLS